MIAPRSTGHARTCLRKGRPAMAQSKPMPKLVSDEEYWLHRAEEVRTIGESIRHPQCKRIMADIAEENQFGGRCANSATREVIASSIAPSMSPGPANKL